jgi:hypothetical protein
MTTAWYETESYKLEKAAREAHKTFPMREPEALPQSLEEQQKALETLRKRDQELAEAQELTKAVITLRAAVDNYLRLQDSESAVLRIVQEAFDVRSKGGITIGNS